MNISTRDSVLIAVNGLGSRRAAVVDLFTHGPITLPDVLLTAVLVVESIIHTPYLRIHTHR